MTTASDRVLWTGDLADFLSVNRTTIWRLEREGKLPAPDVVMGRRRGRLESTMRAFLATTVTGAPSEAPPALASARRARRTSRGRRAG